MWVQQDSVENAKRLHTISVVKLEKSFFLRCLGGYRVLNLWTLRPTLFTPHYFIRHLIAIRFFVQSVLYIRTDLIYFYVIKAQNKCFYRRCANILVVIHIWYNSTRQMNLIFVFPLLHHLSKKLKGIEMQSVKTIVLNKLFNNSLQCLDFFTFDRYVCSIISVHF